MKRQIIIDQDGIGVAVVYKDEIEDGLFELSDALSSDFGPRYKLVDGSIVDSFVGKTDEEVHAALAQDEVMRAAALAAAKPSVPVMLTKVQFMDLFEEGEMEAIYTAAKSVVSVEIYLDKLKAMDVVDLKDNATISDIGKLQAAGILTADRATAILGNSAPTTGTH